MHESRFQEARSQDSMFKRSVFERSVFEEAVFKKTSFTELVSRELARDLSHDDGNNNRSASGGATSGTRLASFREGSRPLLRRPSMRDQRGDYLEESQYQVRKVNPVGETEQPG